jgi:hypothetical protein
VGQESFELNMGVVAMPQNFSAGRRGANDEKEKKVAEAVARRGAEERTRVHGKAPRGTGEFDVLHVQA